ncbi:hypothetical protein Skr01_75360 [Sphaerisporangium krabiense]|uniref:Uncharacterized protein n=1 Tax=Sphaerisporangium krabiense TaxID=763782 RepID=A0A7W9DTD7_9ACTN|nr:hypothetical protein [Sphaerisporangium krabiense]GII67451.1 hypothetical protein Skr01_75360 [Sphaerisporangium krabiense]
MHRNLERLGAGLLALFVPNIRAAGLAGACAWNRYPSCWQCGGAPCTAYCCDGLGCNPVICG